MITINATLVLQAVNFLFAWWFIDRFFLRSFVRDIQKERAQLSYLVTDVDAGRAKVLGEIDAKEVAWQRLRVQFKKKVPHIQETQHLSFSGVLCPVSLSLEEKKRTTLLKDVKNSIVQQVLHDS